MCEFQGSIKQKCFGVVCEALLLASSDIFCLGPSAKPIHLPVKPYPFGMDRLNADNAKARWIHREKNRPRGVHPACGWDARYSHCINDHHSMIRRLEGDTKEKYPVRIGWNVKVF